MDTNDNNDNNNIDLNNSSNDNLNDNSNDNSNDNIKNNNSLNNTDTNNNQLNNNQLNNNKLNNNQLNNNQLNNNQENNQQQKRNTNNIDINYFKQILKEYLKLDEEILTLQKALKQRKNKQESLNQCLLTFLNTNSINEVQLEGNYKGQQLAPQVSNRVKGPNKTEILKVLEENLKENPNLYDAIKNELEGMKTTVSVETVKIKKIKSSKNKSSRQIKQKSEESNNLLLNN